MKCEQFSSVTLSYWQNYFLNHFSPKKKCFQTKFLIPFWLPFLANFTLFARIGEQCNWNPIKAIVYYICVQNPPVYNLQKPPFRKQSNLPHSAKAIHFDKVHAFVNHKQTFYKTVSLFLLIPYRHV